MCAYIYIHIHIYSAYIYIYIHIRVCVCVCVCVYRLSWWLNGKESACNVGDLQEMEICSLGQEDPLEKEIATHSVFWPGKFSGQRSLVCCNPWVCKRVGHDWMTKQQHIIFYTFYICIYNGIPLSHYKITKFFYIGGLGERYAK